MIIQVTVLIVALIAVGLSSIAVSESTNTANKANALTQTALELQNSTINFEPYLLPYYVTATVGDLYTSMPLDNFGRVETYGSLNLSIVAITPHASIINFTEKNIVPLELNQPFFVPNFNVTVNNNADWINSDNFSGTSLSVIPWLPYEERGGNQFFDYKPQSFVEPGVTLINFVIPIHASVSLNQTLQSSFYGASLGTVYFEFDMYDVQLKRTVAVYNGSTNILTNINPNYR